MRGVCTRRACSALTLVKCSRFGPLRRGGNCRSQIPGDGSNVYQPFRFPGQYEDPETGLYYNYFRDYDSQLGRYIQADPIGLAGGINVFNYSEVNPVNIVDPLGLYGTNDCSYYKKRCAETGGDYYCKTAQEWCDRFPKYPDPDPSQDTDYEGWARCTRKCLQDCDAEKAAGKCKDKVDDFMDKVHWDCHSKCYTQCAAGKITGNNPY